MFEISMRIEAPAEHVFAWLQDVEAAPRWYSAVQTAAKLGEGPACLGSRYTFTREIGGRTLENVVEITEFDDGKILTLSSVSGPTPFT